jgi:hypothetical protein
MVSEHREKTFEEQILCWRLISQFISYLGEVSLDSIVRVEIKSLNLHMFGTDD